MTPHRLRTLEKSADAQAKPASGGAAADLLSGLLGGGGDSAGSGLMDIAKRLF